MKILQVLFPTLLFFWIAPLAQGQFLGVGGGGLLPQDLTGENAAEAVSRPPRSEFSNGGIFTLDAGLRRFRYGTAGFHYSFSSTGLHLERGDAFGSSAEIGLTAHTITADLRARAPSAYRFRFFGLAGAGLTRFGLEVKRAVEVPFPGGAPAGFTSFVFTYGAGVERHLHQLLHLRLEARDYLTPVSEQLFRPGGLWHRVVIIGGFTLGL